MTEEDSVDVVRTDGTDVVSGSEAYITYLNVESNRYTITRDGLRVYDTKREKEVKIHKDHYTGHSYMFCQLKTDENKMI